MKRILAIILVLCTIFCLCACGKDKEQGAQPAQQSAGGEVAANVNPTFVDWGNRRGEENSADPWYPDGKIGEEFIYFGIGESSSGIVCYRENAGELVSQTPCALTEDLHLVAEGEGEDFDIIFPGEFHAYDTKAGKWYIRANEEFLLSMFSGKSFAEKTDSNNTLSFNEDGTCVEVYQGTEYSGTWKLINATTIRFTISEEEYYDFDLILNGDNTLDHLDEYNNREFYLK